MSFADYTDIESHSGGTRPTIGELVPQYVAVGVEPRKAVRYIVDSHMRSAVARGKGYKAARRARALLDRLGHDIQAMAQRMASNRKRRWADEQAERHSEARRHSKLADIVNFHE